MVDPPDIVVQFEDRGELERAVEQNLSSGGVLAPGADGVQRCDLCRAVLVHPESGERLVLDASVVMVSEQGVGLAFVGFDDAMRRRIEAFAAGTGASVGAAADDEDGDSGADDEGDAAWGDDEEGAGGSGDGTRPARSRARGGAGDVQRRVRELSPREAQKLAAKGDLAERRALERVYGKLVWDHLLKNPRVSKPEVAALARKHTVPRPLLEAIVDHAAWIRDPQVRRALLANPRMTRSMIDKVLRVTPRAELKLMPKQTAYPRAVREQASRLLG